MAYCALSREQTFFHIVLSIVILSWEVGVSLVHLLITMTLELMWKNMS